LGGPNYTLQASHVASHIDRPSRILLTVRPARQDTVLLHRMTRMITTTLPTFNDYWSKFSSLPSTTSEVTLGILKLFDRPTGWWLGDWATERNPPNMLCLLIVNIGLDWRLEDFGDLTASPTDPTSCLLETTSSSPTLVVSSFVLMAGSSVGQVIRMLLGCGLRLCIS